MNRASSGPSEPYAPRLLNAACLELLMVEMVRAVESEVRQQGLEPQQAQSELYGRLERVGYKVGQAMAEKWVAGGAERRAC